MLLLVLVATGVSTGAPGDHGCAGLVQNATDYEGNDLHGGTRLNVTSPAACCALCAGQAGCNAWSLWVSGQQCYLKASGKGSRTSAGQSHAPSRQRCNCDHSGQAHAHAQAHAKEPTM